MSFETLKLNELREVADSFGVDLAGAKTKKQVISSIEEEGVSFDLYQKFYNAEKDDSYIEAEIVSNPVGPRANADDVVLVKMERSNPTYQTAGFTFTREHPFVPMTSFQAQLIFDLEQGFRLATPREIQEYYS
jgi:hypothetical protein